MENLRIWSARLTGERTSETPASFVRLGGLAIDGSPQVRFAVATALRQHTSSSLTVDRPIESSDSIPGIIEKLTLASKDSVDRTLPFLIWMALETLAAKDPTPLLDWLASSGHQAAPLSHSLTYKLMLRICDTRKPGHLDAAAGFLAHTAGQHPGIATSALGGLLEGQKGRAAPPQHLPDNLFAILRGNLKGDQEKMQINRLGALWGDSDAAVGTKKIFDTPVDRSKNWHEFNIDLSKSVGQHIDLQLENVANNWMYEFAFGDSVSVTTNGHAPTPDFYTRASAASSATATCSSNSPNARNLS